MRASGHNRKNTMAIYSSQPHAASPSDEYLTTEGVAALLNIPPRQVTALFRQGILPAMKLGRKTLRFPVGELRRALENLTENRSESGKARR